MSVVLRAYFCKVLVACKTEIVSNNILFKNRQCILVNLSFKEYALCSFSFAGVIHFLVAKYKQLCVICRCSIYLNVGTRYHDICRISISCLKPSTGTTYARKNVTIVLFMSNIIIANYFAVLWPMLLGVHLICL